MGFDNPELVTKQLKKKWANLLQKYKDIKFPPSGKAAEDGEFVTTTWPHFDSMDKFPRDRLMINPPNIVGSSKLHEIEFISPDSAVTDSEVELEMQLDDYAETGESSEQVLPIINNTPQNTCQNTPQNIPTKATSFKYKYKYKYKHKLKSKRNNKHNLPFTSYAPSTSSQSSSHSDSRTSSPMTGYHIRPEANRRKSDVDKSAKKRKKDSSESLLQFLKRQDDRHERELKVGEAIVGIMSKFFDKNSNGPG